MKRMGWGFDWDRCVSAHEPEYYRWTQWLFLKLFEAGLAYRKGAPVKWCPVDQVVLANEQVHDGRCEYCGNEVVAKNLEQWFFKTTAYADELLDDLPSIEWQDRIKAMQRNWIGRSEGAEVLFRVDELDEDVPVFTTRPDTLFGATFFVLAPEHPLVEQLAARSPNADELREYVQRAAVKRGEERAAAETKTGVFTGFFATNPVNDARIPIWVADYVLMEYGTGAIMAVPAHDERDGEFAETLRSADRPGDRRRRPAHRLGAVQLAAGRGGEGARSSRGSRSAGARKSAISLPPPRLGLLAAALLGRADPDRLLRRPRRRRAARERAAASILPEVDDYKPKGIAPLESAVDWVRAPCPTCGKEGRREVETMDTFVDSSWYFLRYCDPYNDEAAWDRKLVDWWCPVDQYIGGVDHATMHLIYARFFMKALNDLGLRRLPRAVHAPLLERLGAARRHEDVEVEGQRDRAGRLCRGVRRRCGAALHPLHRPRRPGHGLDRRRRRGDGAVRAAAVPVRLGGGGAWRRAAARFRRTSCRARRTRRSRASPTTSGGGSRSTRRSPR